jgi:murein DD-endopeptidase MepM/ murein hydrolase activator NlpD
MRILIFILLGASLNHAFGQGVEVLVRPDAIHVEAIGGNIVPMERVFFHIIIHNTSAGPADIQWIRFDLVNDSGVVFSGQYSGQALSMLFDSAIERRRIEPTPRGNLTLGADERKAISDLFLDLPAGHIGESMVVEVAYGAGGKAEFNKVSAPLKRVGGFSGRLPFQGIWYVANEHGFLDPHKRFVVEAFAYDFLQIGANGRSFQGDGSNNSDYYAYGQKVLAAKDGNVVFVRTDVSDNVPSQTINTDTPSGNLVVIDHGRDQYGYYGRLKTDSINVEVGTRVRAGDPIGEVGNSGDSWEPHLHFHVMNNPDSTQADGIPIVFENWKGQSYGRVPVERAQGIPAKGEFVQP